MSRRVGSKPDATCPLDFHNVPDSDFTLESNSHGASFDLVFVASLVIGGAFDTFCTPSPALRVTMLLGIENAARTVQDQAAGLGTYLPGYPPHSVPTSLGTHPWLGPP